MNPAAYLPEARDDIDDTFLSYETRAAGLGDRFLNALRRSIERVEDNPLLYGEVATGVRAGPVRRFPHVVYYRPEAGRVLVIAVRHGHDDPAIWQGRA